MSKRTRGWWIANGLMLAGALMWLGGELFGVHRNATVKDPGNDTTSQWVWAMEKRYWISRILVGTFVVSLLGHFLWHKMLLP